MEAITVSTLAADPDERVGILDADGQVRENRTVPDLADEVLVDIYRTMRLARHFDTRAVSLQRQGRLGTYPPMAGQEGAQVASAYALADADWIYPSYREHASALVRGRSIEDTLLYWMGSDAGARLPESTNIFTAAVPIATQILHATGAAWAAKLTDESSVHLCYFGDGATSEGDFHEGLNFAGVFDTPSVFFCNNNQWAISVPRERQTASATLAQKADAYGFDGVQVDGMDPLAVYQVTHDAVEKARDPPDGKRRPTLIEAIQYRFGAHTTADDPSVYREDSEVEQWRGRDPIPRLETFLLETGRLDSEAVSAIGTAAEDAVRDAIEEAETTVRPDPEEIFEHVFAETPDRIADQQAALDRLREEYGDEAFLGE